MKIQPQALTDRRDLAVDISRTAGDKILEFFVSEIAVTHKEDETPLTEADLAANKIIIDQLTAIDAKLPVITEESSSIPFEKRSGWSLSLIHI